MDEGVRRYRAFISYSHRDKRWGRWLHTRLETYRVPKALVGRRTRMGEVPRRLYPIFRDKDEIPTSASLKDTIDDALERSDFLVVICSPRSAQSVYVNEEVRKFRAMGHDDRILAIIVDGEPHADTKPWCEAEECFPPALRFRVDASGAVTDEPSEPIAADVRPGQDSKRVAKLRLIAGLTGLDYAELHDRDKIATTKRRVRYGVAALLLAGVLAAAGVLAWRGQKEATKQSRIAGEKTQEAAASGRTAQQRLVRVYNEQGAKLLAQNDATGALVWHVAALRVAERLHADQPGARAVVNQRVRVRHTLIHIPPLCSLLLHDGPVYRAALSPDGEHIATLEDYRAVLVWNLKTGKRVGRSLGTGDKMWSVEYDPSGKRLVTAGEDGAAEDGAAHVWDAATGRLALPALKHDKKVNHATFSPDGTRVATASDDGTARLWGATTGKPAGKPMRHVLNVRHADVGPPRPPLADVDHVAFSPDGTRVVTSCSGSYARVWDAKTGEAVSPPVKHHLGSGLAAFSADGKHVISGGVLGVPHIWDAATGKLVGKPLEHIGVARLARRPKGQRDVLVVGRSGTARVWDAETAEAVSPPFHHGGSLLDGGYFVHGGSVVTGSSNKTARAWDARDGRPETPPLWHGGAVWFARCAPKGYWMITASEDGAARVWLLPGLRALEQSMPHRGPVNHVAFSPDGRLVATASNDHTACVFDAEFALAAAPYMRHQTIVYEAVFSPDGRRILTASEDKAGLLWDAGTGQRVGAPLRHQSGVGHVAFDATGRKALTASRDGTVRLWDAHTGDLLTVPLEHKKMIHAACFSPDGGLVATAGSDDVVRVWDAETGLAVSPVIRCDQGAYHLAFGPDGKRLAVAGGRGVRIVDPRTGAQGGPTLEHDGRVRWIEFGPSGKRLATACNDGAARIWDATTGQLVASAMRHDNDVLCATFSSDGLRLLTASADRSARVWDAATGEPITAPLRHDGLVGHAAFSPDGWRAATASMDKTAKVWDLGKDNRSVDDLELLAQVLSARHIDEAGGLAFHAPEELRALMKEATQRPQLFYHDDPARSKRFSEAWQRWRKALGLDK